MQRVFAIVLGLALATGALAGLASAAPGYSPDQEELAFLGLINDYRAQVGAGPLTINAVLGAAADYHSLDMATHNYFGHILWDGTDPGQNIANFGYTGERWGEIIAAGMDSAGGALLAWQASPSHDATMRDGGFREIGIGRYYDANSVYGWYWTATFGAAATAEPRRDRHRDGTVVELAQEVDPAAPAAPAAPTGPTTSVDGSSVTADDDTNPAVDGGGSDLVYGDVDTGGDQGTVTIYDPNGTLPVATDGTTTTDGSVTVAPAPPTPPDVPTHEEVVTGTYSVENEDGTATAFGDATTPPAPPPDSSGSAPAPPAAAPPAPATAGGSCANYGSWYDAQVAYEAAGGLAADPALVEAFDADYDGIACEEMMAA
jgi:hypothetical protein